MIFTLYTRCVVVLGLMLYNLHSLAITDQNRCGGGNCSSSTYVLLWKKKPLKKTKTQSHQSQCLSRGRIFSERACSFFTSITRFDIPFTDKFFFTGPTSFLNQSLLIITPSWSAIQKSLPLYWQPPRLMVWQWLVRLFFFFSILTICQLLAYKYTHSVDANPYIPGGGGAQFYNPTNNLCVSQSKCWQPRLSFSFFFFSYRSVRNFIIDVRRYVETFLYIKFFFFLQYMSIGFRQRNHRARAFIGRSPNQHL